MIRLMPLFFVAALSGCGVPVVMPGMSPDVSAPEAPPPLPPEVATALPPGTPSSVVFQDAAGCYLYSIEVTIPPSGFPVRDALGNPICEGQPVAVAPPSPPIIAQEG